MEELRNPYIKLKDKLDGNDYSDINKLQKHCLEIDKTSLKLELDYKLSRAEIEKGSINNLNEFMYYNDKELIGYIGIDSFGGGTLEVNGMVHPEYRRRGIFKRLFQLVKEEWTKRNVRNMLLLSDNNSISGQEFIRSTGACHEHTEYEMFLRGKASQDILLNNVLLRKANNNDAKEIAYQNSIYFDGVNSEVALIVPEEEEKCGMLIYMAEVDNKVIGKVHLEVSSEVNGIYGLGVIPDYRGKGYGRGILTSAVKKLQEINSKEIMLQVSAKNSNALNLYKSCGFVETSTMDYYLLSK